MSKLKKCIVEDFLSNTLFDVASFAKGGKK